MEGTSKQLQKDAIGLGESVIIGVAGTAPSFSLAAATTTLITAVGALSAGSVLYCGLIMFGATFAFMHLNHAMPSAGASYSWVGKIFGRAAGFTAGWCLMVAATINMVSGTTPAASATLVLLSPSHAMSPAAIAFVSAIWLLIITAVVLRGIKPTAHLQNVMTVLELLVLVVLIGSAIVQYGPHPTHPFLWSSLSLTSFTPELFATGALTSLFLFWGWDVTLNLSEETRDSHSAGRSAVAAMLIVILLLVLFMVSCQLVLTDEELANANTNIVFVLARKLLPDPWGYVAVISVMLSTIGTLDAQILQFTRTMYAKGRDGALHPFLATLHPRWQTPWVATLVISGVGLVLICLSSLLPTVAQLIKVSVSAIGFQVACYYSLAGFACAWHFRRKARQSLNNFVFLALWPTVSSVFLVLVALYSIPTFDWLTNLVGIGGIVIGAVPYLLSRHRTSVVPA